MTGKYGTLTDYIRAYQQYGGTPPIPEFSDVERGDPRPKWHWRALLIPTAILAFLPVALIWSEMSAPLTTPDVAALALAWSGMLILVSMMLTQPFSDWWRDVPRYGLETVDTKTEMQEVAT